MRISGRRKLYITFEPLSVVVLRQILQEKHRVRMQRLVVVGNIARISGLRLLDEHLFSRTQAGFDAFSPQLFSLQRCHGILFGLTVLVVLLLRLVPFLFLRFVIRGSRIGFFRLRSRGRGVLLGRHKAL